MPLPRVVVLLALLVSSFAFGQDPAPLLAEARDLRQAKDYVASVAKFEAAFKLRTPAAGQLYQGACAAALAGKSELALTWLQQAVEGGWANPQSTQNNPELNSLHDLPRWKEILATMRERRKALDANIDKPLRAQLRMILADDQKYRGQLDEVERKSGRESQPVRDLRQVMAQKDAENLAKVTAILDTRGWLGPDVVGDDGSSALFLVIQHADLKVQQKYLPLMRAAVKARKAQPGDLALLEDRVALGEGRRQIYGSQLQANPTTGKYELAPLDDPERVDQRRAAVGLPPLGEYLKHWDLVWDVAAYKQPTHE